MCSRQMSIQMSSEPVAVKSLADVSDDKRKERYSNIALQFAVKYGSKPQFFARAPGRVNIIGEHIDYCGYGVLPMAIEQDIVMAVSLNDSQKLTLANTNSLYSDFECSLDDVKIEGDKPEWYKYFLCGVKGVAEALTQGSGDCDKILRGMEVMVDGSIPPSSGLSSSSAMVCCAALVTVFANKVAHKFSKLELAELCAKCERYIGTQGGGMDQAICFLAQFGVAKLIEFNPLEVFDVRLPPDATFVVANSCHAMNKAASAEFNIRVMECRLATKVLAKARGVPGWREMSKLSEVQQECRLTLDDMLTVVLDTLHTDPYTKEEVATLLDITTQQLDDDILTPNTRHVGTFHLYERAVHVFSEANRVVNFKVLCGEQPTDILSQLGHLMTESHSSCRDLYECSCDELDELTRICLESGALGSRLTGAGWGGCCVSLVESSKVTDFIVKIRDRFYNKSPDRQKIVSTSLFATQPGQGAAIYTAE